MNAVLNAMLAMAVGLKSILQIISAKIVYLKCVYHVKNIKYVLNRKFKTYFRKQFVSSFKIQPKQSVLNIF